VTTQNNWRFCTKCYSLFWNGYATRGFCALGGSHSPFRSCSPTDAATSWDFALRIARTAPPAKSPGADPVGGPAGTQNNWRFCTKCYVLFFYGLYGFAGVCAHGGQHSPRAGAGRDTVSASWDFALRIVSTAPPPGSPGADPIRDAAGTQSNWRFCTKCYALFFYGVDHLAGMCPRGGQHSPMFRDSPTHAATSWNFALQVVSTSPPRGAVDPTIQLVDVSVGGDLFVQVGGSGFTPHGNVVINYDINADLNNRDNASQTGRTVVNADSCGLFEMDFQAGEPGYVTCANVEAIDQTTGRTSTASAPLWTAVL
jgi:hypothetical protein